MSQIGFDSYRVRLTFLLLGTVRSQLARKVWLDDLKSVLERVELLGDPLFPGGVVQGVPGFVIEFLYLLWLFRLWVVVRKGWRVGFGARRLVHSRISF